MRDNSDFNGHQSIFANSGFSKKNPYIYILNRLKGSAKYENHTLLRKRYQTCF